MIKNLIYYHIIEERRKNKLWKDIKITTDRSSESGKITIEVQRKHFSIILEFIVIDDHVIDTRRSSHSIYDPNIVKLFVTEINKNIYTPELKCMLGHNPLLVRPKHSKLFVKLLNKLYKANRIDVTVERTITSAIVVRSGSRTILAISYDRPFDGKRLFQYART